MSANQNYIPLQGSFILGISHISVNQTALLWSKLTQKSNSIPKVTIFGRRSNQFSLWIIFGLYRINTQAYNQVTVILSLI